MYLPTLRYSLTVLAAVVAMAAALGACGNEESEGTQSGAKSATTATPTKRQVIERFETEFDAAQAERLFGGSPSGVDPMDLVGRWEMQLNVTLGLLEVRAPDGGGPILEIVEDRGDAYVLEERECPKPFVVGVEKTPDSLALSRRRGRCDETIDLLIEQPWQRSE